MAWTKDTVSQSPKTVYTAPASAYPIIKVVYNPDAENKWTVEYAWLNESNNTQSAIEAIMGL